MSGLLQSSRQFKRYNAPQFSRPSVVTRLVVPDMTPWMEAQYEESHSYPAFMLSSDSITPIRIAPWKGQLFPIAATEFERTWSLLCGNGDFIPVVDADYWVVGHVGEVSDGFGKVFVPIGRQYGSMKDLVDSGKPVIVANANPDSARFKDHDEGVLASYRFLTDPDGLVLALVSQRSRDGLAPPDIDPFVLIGIAQIGVAIGKGVGKYLARKAVDAGRIAVTTFRQAMANVEKKLLARGAAGEAAAIRKLTEEELSLAWGGGAARPLTDNQVERAIELLRNGQDVHVESIGQMRQVQGELGQLGVRSESSSTLIPQRAAENDLGQRELEGSFRDGRGTYRVDPPHAPGKLPYSAHNEYPHINITLRDGKTLAIIVTGAKSF